MSLPSCASSRLLFLFPLFFLSFFFCHSVPLSFVICFFSATFLFLRLFPFSLFPCLFFFSFPSHLPRFSYPLPFFSFSSLCVSSISLSLYLHVASVPTFFIIEPHSSILPHPCHKLSFSISLFPSPVFLSLSLQRMFMYL